MQSRAPMALIPALSLILISCLCMQWVDAQSPQPGSSLEAARAFESRIRNVVHTARRRVVSIRPLTGGRKPADGVVKRPSRNGGSGVVIRATGFILTNDHVVAGVDQVEVIFSNGERVPGAVWARDEVGDLAIVKVKVAWALPAAEFGDSRKAKVGQPVLALGNALGLSLDNGEPAATFGILSATHRYQGGSRVYGDALQFDASVNPGNSGGGLFGMDGRLLGITGRISIRGTVSKSVGVGFAVPAHQIQLGLKELLAGRDIVHGFLGVRFQRDAQGPGVLVASIVRDSPAEKAGLRVTDVLLKVDDVILDHAVRLQNILSVQRAGQKLKIELRRGLEKKTITVTLDRRRKRGKNP
jgi:S1-C subfamily serine protease